MSQSGSRDGDEDTAPAGARPLFADLHLHTHYSDGTYTPAELAVQAGRYGLVAIALTDHDTMEGCAALQAACEREGIEFVPGTELTAEHEGRELHLLGYYVDPMASDLQREFQRFQVARQSRIREMVCRLNELQVPLQSETVFALANCRSPGRPHVARALVQGGYCGSVDEAFERFLKKRRPAWVPKRKMSAQDAIGLIHGSGGLAVMAHPGLNHNDALIPKMVEAGLDGLECFHTKHSSGAVAHYLNIARENGLLVTGGSDCHGHSKGRPLIGTVRLPVEYFQRLKAAAQHHAQQRADDGVPIVSVPDLPGSCNSIVGAPVQPSVFDSEKPA